MKKRIVDESAQSHVYHDVLKIWQENRETFVLTVAALLTMPNIFFRKSTLSTLLDNQTHTEEGMIATTKKRNEKPNAAK